jgi:hypothetical protein
MPTLLLESGKKAADASLRRVLIAYFDVRFEEPFEVLAVHPTLETLDEPLSRNLECHLWTV